MNRRFALEGVTVAFHTPDGIRPVLREIDLKIEPGEFVAVVGANGSGKSTLARVLAGLCPISKGRLERGMDAEGQSRVQMVFQNPEAQIVGETVYEDVCFGLENRAVPPSEMPRRVEQALKMVGMEHRMYHPVESLSGGQKQLLGIAGCLALQAEAILFDEVTAMLDPAARTRVLQVVSELHRQGTTIVWVTQVLDELAFAGRVVALEAGRVAYDGGTREFFYGEEEAGESACQRLRFVSPYTVQVALELERQGMRLAARPLTPQELREAVSA